MAHTPKLNRAALKERGVYDEKRFYRLLSEKCNYMSDENVHMFYLGLVRLVVQELRNQEAIRLPLLGDFALLQGKPASRLVGKQRIIMPAMKLLKFYPLEKLRVYFNTRQHIL